MSSFDLGLRAGPAEQSAELKREGLGDGTS